MKQGTLSDYFIGVGTKVLKGTEVDPDVSNGHELQGVDAFREFLGTPAEKQLIPVTYVWLSDDAEPLSARSTGTWYDSRRGKPHRTAEYRLYYPAVVEEIIRRARADDRLFLCLPKHAPLLALFCERGSSIEQQLHWLFGLEPNQLTDIEQKDFRSDRGRELDIAARYILELINVEVAPPEDERLGQLVARFKRKFPSTREFSKFARAHTRDVDAATDPDGALVRWMDMEERLFLMLEKQIVGPRLEQGFLNGSEPDVDGFIQYSLQVQNRRKSRAGWAFANHIEELLIVHKVRYVREATTEKRNGPDFLFPGEAEYHDPSWPAARLTMLAAKTSCKDRWRQVLKEAHRIEGKHLVTLEPGISPTQTTEMKSEHLKLVVPALLQNSYQTEQRAELMRVTDFLQMILERQQRRF
ncbi:MAG TPA: type II restriction endonuclease [Rhizomicrobium sp.]|jgi:hypothetical protein|nr:type II restriction endonuclease [Rhizomicrobium sp.]